MYWRADDQRQKRDWERARWMAYKIVSPHLKRGTTLLQFHEFEWEKEEKPKIKTKKEFYDLKKIFYPDEQK